MYFKDFLNNSLNRIGLKSQAKYVEFGYGQVEPNHLSAQRTAQIYAQLPANPDIQILEQGQFVKYDYAANGNGIGEVNFNGAGEWMLVYNEIKLYRDHPDGTKQWDCEFAMIKDDYQARIYTPYDWEAVEPEYHNGMYLNGKDEKGNTSITVPSAVTIDSDGKYVTIAGERYAVATKTFTDTPADTEAGTEAVTHTGVGFTYNSVDYELIDGVANNVPIVYNYDDVTKDVEDYYEWGFTNDPWKKLGIYREKKMRPGTAMVPRVFKTNVGDIYTTNFVNETTLAVGDLLYVGANGILSKTKNGSAVAANTSTGVMATAASGDMTWQVVKVYTMPDDQKGVKLMRIA